jgi:hypothetical protein
MSELRYPCDLRVTSIMHMCCDHERSARVCLHDYKKDYPSTLKADISSSVVASHDCQ